MCVNQNANVFNFNLNSGMLIWIFRDFVEFYNFYFYTNLQNPYDFIGLNFIEIEEKIHYIGLAKILYKIKKKKIKNLKTKSASFFGDSLNLWFFNQKGNVLHLRKNFRKIIKNENRAVFWYTKEIYDKQLATWSPQSLLKTIDLGLGLNFLKKEKTDTLSVHTSFKLPNKKGIRYTKTQSFLFCELKSIPFLRLKKMRTYNRELYSKSRIREKPHVRASTAHLEQFDFFFWNYSIRSQARLFNYKSDTNEKMTLRIAFKSFVKTCTFNLNINMRYFVNSIKEKNVYVFKFCRVRDTYNFLHLVCLDFISKQLKPFTEFNQKLQDINISMKDYFSTLKSEYGYLLSNTNGSTQKMIRRTCGPFRFVSNKRNPRYVFFNYMWIVSFFFSFLLFWNVKEIYRTLEILIRSAYIFPLILMFYFCFWGMNVPLPFLFALIASFSVLIRSRK
jgi:hypothetical protein